MEGKKINKSNLKKLGRVKWLCIWLFAVSMLLHCGTPTEGQVTLKWNAPTGNIDGTPISLFKGDYRLYYGTAPGKYTQKIEIKDENSVVTYQVFHLNYGKTYFFAVTAVNTLGKESGYSNEAIRVATVP